MANFRNTIHIKALFEAGDTSDHAINTYAKVIEAKLTALIHKEQQILASYTPQEISDDYELESVKDIIDKDLEEARINFENIRDSIADGSDPSEYSYDSYTEWFDSSLNTLYDVADTITHPSNTGIHNRFLYIA